MNQPRTIILVAALAIGVCLTLTQGQVAEAQYCPAVGCTGVPAMCTITITVVPNTLATRFDARVYAGMGYAISALCAPGAPTVAGTTATFMLMATANTGPGAICNWEVRSRRPGYMYYDLGFCRIDMADDDLPVELMEFSVEPDESADAEAEAEGAETDDG